MKVVKGGVTHPLGYQANGLWCGIKRSGKPDLSLIACDRAVPTAGVFTKNSVKAAPLLVCEQHLKNQCAQAIVINSGNANCFTGKFGLLYAQKTAKMTAQLLDIKPKDVLVSSTGIIGKPLPFEKIAKALPNLVKGRSATKGKLAAKGILTTDKVIKEIAVECTIAGKKVTIGGCAKGSGMIEPHMATMLAFITTDAAISPKILKTMLKEAVAKTFNRISVDGCMSTNDMVTLMANGEAGNKTISTQGKHYQTFLKALEYVCLDLAKKIVLDGEGATKFIEVNIKGAKTEKQATQIARTVANSNLVKTAAFGSNPNWGRVAAAVGSMGLGVTEDNIKISFSPFSKKNIQINVQLSIGHASSTVYTSDLSHEYVRINSLYN